MSLPLPTVRRRRPSRIALLAALLGAAPVPAYAQAESPAAPTTIAVASAATRLDAAQLPAGDGGVVTVRAVRQRLGLHAADHDQRVRSGVLVGYGYDAGLPADPAHPLLAERQLDPSLESAWIAYRVLPAVDLQAGRFTTDTFAWERIDGAALRLLPTPHISLELTGGARPGPGTTTADGDRTDRNAEGALLRTRPGALLLGTSLRYRGPRASAFGAWSDERLPTRSALLRRMLRTGATIGTAGGPSARLDASVEAIRWELTSLRGVVRLPIEDAGSIDLSGRFERPVFALDSVFSVFPVEPGARIELGFDRDAPNRAWRVNAGARVVPEVTSLAGFSVHTQRRLLTFQARTEAELGANRSAVSTHVTLQAQTSRTVALEPSVSAHAFRDRTGRQGPDWAGAVRAAQGIRLELGRASAGWARVDAGWDSFVGLSWRMLARLDVHLPAWRRQRGA